MEAYLLIAALVAFVVAGLFLVGAINHYQQASRLSEETRKLALRVLLAHKRS